MLGASLCSWVSASTGQDFPLPLSPCGMDDRDVPQEHMFPAGLCSEVPLVLGTLGLWAGSPLALQLPGAISHPSPAQGTSRRGAQSTGVLHPGGSILPWCFPAMEGPWSSGLPSPPLLLQTILQLCASLGRNSRSGGRGWGGVGGEISPPPLILLGVSEALGLALLPAADGWV